jgi:hypothetical protein
MRIYMIGNDGITLCREPPATVNKGDVAVASRDELHAARLSGKRLLALWNALPGVGAAEQIDGADAAAPGGGRRERPPASGMRQLAAAVRG